MIVEHVFPDDVEDGDVMMVESVESLPGRVRIEYATYIPPTGGREALLNFRAAADSLSDAVADHFRGGDPRLLPTYPPESRIYLAMEAYRRARMVVGR